MDELLSVNVPWSQEFSVVLRFEQKPHAFGFQSYSYSSLKTSPSVTSKGVPSVVLASCVSWPLQCLISTLTQGGDGGYIFRLTCSVVKWGGRNAANNNTGVCSQCLGHTGFVPTHGVCAFPVYTAQDLGCSAGNCLRPALDCMHFPGLSCSGSGTRVLLKGADSVGPAFGALPRSE